MVVNLESLSDVLCEPNGIVCMTQAVGRLLSASASSTTTVASGPTYLIRECSSHLVLPYITALPFYGSFWSAYDCCFYNGLAGVA
eukprot:1402537-Amphidinium_carterae.1